MSKIFSHKTATGFFSCNFCDENAVLMYEKLSLKPINTTLNIFIFNHNCRIDIYSRIDIFNHNCTALFS